MIAVSVYSKRNDMRNRMRISTWGGTLTYSTKDAVSRTDQWYSSSMDKSLGAAMAIDLCLYVSPE